MITSYIVASRARSIVAHMRNLEWHVAEDVQISFNHIDLGNSELTKEFEPPGLPSPEAALREVVTIYLAISEYL